MDDVGNGIEIHNSKEFAENCRRMRNKKGMSQERLALDIGVSTSTIQRIENGKMIPSINLACRIAEGSGMAIVIMKMDPPFSLGGEKHDDPSGHHSMC